MGSRQTYEYNKISHLAFLDYYMPSKEGTAEIENFGALLDDGTGAPSSVGEGVAQKFPQCSKNHRNGYICSVDVVNNGKATPRIFRQRCGPQAPTHQDGRGE